MIPVLFTEFFQPRQPRRYVGRHRAPRQPRFATAAAVASISGAGPETTPANPEIASSAAA